MIRSPQCLCFLGGSLLVFQFMPSTALCSGFLDCSPLPLFGFRCGAALGHSERDFFPKPLSQQVRAGCASSGSCCQQQICQRCCCVGSGYSAAIISVSGQLPLHSTAWQCRHDSMKFYFFFFFNCCQLQTKIDCKSILLWCQWRQLGNKGFLGEGKALALTMTDLHIFI